VRLHETHDVDGGDPGVLQDRREGAAVLVRALEARVPVRVLALLEPDVGVEVGQRGMQLGVGRAGDR
jgi:hypothetical protein